MPLKIGHHIAITLFFLVTSAATAIFAHSGATGIVKQRMDEMKIMAKDVKTVLSMVQGKTDFDNKQVLEAAIRIKNHATRVPELFPKGSISHPSEAKTEIWDNWEEFAEISNKLSASAETLAQAARNAHSIEEIKTSFREMATYCGTCHHKYRAKH